MIRKTFRAGLSFPAAIRHHGGPRQSPRPPGSPMSLLVFVALNFLAASSGALFSPGRWYEDLRKPAWRPPNAAFPVVWTVLYILIAIAGWRVWERASP
jgi:hypothetical protein